MKATQSVLVKLFYRQDGLGAPIYKAEVVFADNNLERGTKNCRDIQELIQQVEVFLLSGGRQEYQRPSGVVFLQGNKKIKRQLPQADFDLVTEALKEYA